MNERQQVHIDYFLKWSEYWQGRKRDETVVMILAACDADRAHLLRTEEGLEDSSGDRSRPAGEAETCAAAWILSRGLVMLAAKLLS